MICPKCNASNADDAKFCSSCGAPLTAAAGMPKNNGFAIASVVLGGVGIVVSWFLLAIPSILAVIFGHIARSQIKASAGQQAGAGMALGGLIMGYVIIALVPIGIIAAISIPQYVEYTNRARISEAFAVSAPVREAVVEARGRGMRFGLLPANPAELGLKPPADYSSRYVRSVSHNAHGQVTIVLSQDPGLGTHAGGTIVLTPVIEGDRIRWRASPDSSIPLRYLPSSYR
jgi:type II secretory pathway pseudopilin PulG